jgi:anaerobic selenocysteine-containing dehydrogenase
MCTQRGLDPRRILSLAPVRGSERILDLAIRSGNFGDRYGDRHGGLNLDTFKAAPHGLIVGSAEPGVPLKTPSGKIELAPEYLLADVPRLRAALTEAPVATVLVSRRTLRSMNSWMNNMPTLVKGRDRCTLLIHPRDAARIGVRNGDPVKVASGDNAVTAPAEVTERIKPGVVSLPHGWGHSSPGTRLTVASRHPGVNINRVNPANLLDTPSGNAVVNGVPVLLTKAERSSATDAA